MSDKKRILLVEDDDMDAEHIEELFLSILEIPHLAPYDYARCKNLACGLSRLEDESFDLILLDLGLPDTTRENALGRITSLYPKIPVVVLTGIDDIQAARQSLREGAQDYLVKGQFKDKELYRCITYAIERHQLKRSLQKTADELEQKSAILQSVFDHMGDGVVVTDKNGALLLYNPAASKILGAGDLFPDALRGQVVDGKEVLITSDNSEDRYVSVTARPIDEQHNAIGGCVAVLHDITERRKVEKLRDEFLSIVSHELRTPLTSISGSLGLVLAGVTGNLTDETREMIGIAQRNSDRLVRLINDLLDIQKLEAGKMDLALQHHRIADIINKSIAGNSGYAHKFNVQLKYEVCEAKDALVLVDEDRILQVMTNLLSNAIKYSPEKGEIVVRATLEGEFVQVSVSDSGPGIPEAFHSEIFGKFNQANGASASKKEGTGLGLSICKAIVSLHGGEIGFETEMGKGTTFYFTLQQVSEA